MHISPYENNNRAIVDIENGVVPHNYFNIVKLKKGENFEDQISGYECCIVPATGTVDITVCGEILKLSAAELKMFGEGSLNVSIFQVAKSLLFDVSVIPVKYLSQAQNLKTF